MGINRLRSRTLKDTFDFFFWQNIDRRRYPGLKGEFFEQAGTNGIYGTNLTIVNTLCRLWSLRLKQTHPDTLLQLIGGLVGEGGGHDLLGVDWLVFIGHPPGNFFHQEIGFARAGTGTDKADIFHAAALCLPQSLPK